MNSAWLAKLTAWPIIAGCFLVTLVVGVMGYKESTEMTQLAESGIAASAVIKEVKWSQKRGMDRNFDLTVSFTTKLGQKVTEVLRVDTETGKRARDDDDFLNLPVVYLPEDPSVLRVAGEGDHSRGMFVVAMITLIAGAILCFLRIFAIRAGR